MKIGRVSNPAVDRGAVHVDIKDRKKNPDAAHATVGKFAFLDFHDIGNATVRRRDDDSGACGNLPSGIAEKPESEEQEDGGNRREPGDKIKCGEGGCGPAEDEPDALF